MISVLVNVSSGAGTETIGARSGTHASEFEYSLPVIRISGFGDQVIFVETFGKSDATSITGWSTSSVGTLTLDAQNAIEGNALKIQNLGDDLVVSRPVTLTPNKSYKLGYYLKMDPGQVSLMFISTPEKILPSDTYEAEFEGGWYYYETFFRAGAASAVFINLKIKGTGNLWIDQIILYETEKMASVRFPTAPNYWQTDNELLNVNLTLNKDCE